jgi:TolB-like protein
MRRQIITLILLLGAMAAAAQDKPALGILPFTGGSGRDGDTIANLFANSGDLNRDFRIIPRTSSAGAITIEQQFQRAGLTDSDTIAELGKQMGAAYVVSGHITRFADKNLLLISIIRVETMEQIAGDYREYGAIEEIRRLLPEMAAAIVTSVQRQGSASAGGLAVLPLNIQDTAVEQDDAELLAQILATEIANTHRYEVLPRTTTINDVIKEQEIQRSGLTDRETMAAIGAATNAQYVLAGTITKLGSMNLFDAKILHIGTGVQVVGKDQEYRNLVDGIEIMRQLARDLTGITEETARTQVKAAEEKRTEERAARAKLFSLGFAAGSTFTTPWALVTIGATASLLPYTFFDAGVDVGSIHGYEGRDDLLYVSLYPYAHLNGYFPLENIGGLYIGVGAGYILAFYAAGDEKNLFRIPAAEAAAGLYLGRNHHYFRAAYALRTPIEQIFGALNHKIILGYSFRWE